MGAAWIRRFTVLGGATLLALGAPVDGLAAATYTVGPTSIVSAARAGQNAEAESAADFSLGYVYEDWMGSSAIGFGRSTDGGRSSGAPLSLPVASESNGNP